jgi:hypothetical protein
VTETRKPPRCHYDRNLRQRVTTDHRDDCPSLDETRPPPDRICPAAGRGCAPCTAPHCLICGREHATNSEPDTCPDCLSKVREDLTELAADYQALAVEAIAGGADGRLVAAAPIPGGTAAILHGPSVRLDQMRITRTTAEDHRRSDPIPPLAVLAQWEDLYRAWFGHNRGQRAKRDAYDWYAGRPPSRATVQGAVRYLAEQLDHMANGPAVRQGPDWVAFTRQVQHLRAGLERALHDEQEPERGVACFECGDQLVRRFRDPKRCRHRTPARAELERALVRQQRGQDWLRVVGTYPELGPMEQDLAAARGPSAQLIADARRPCAKCQAQAGGQGGLADPRAGQSWECPGCRKAYDVGEYVTAVRRDLIDGDGWAQVTAAAQAATDLVGMVVSDALVRKWAATLTVASVCAWRPPVKGRVQRTPQRLVFWPDVADQANVAVDRMLERRRKAEQVAAWRKAVEDGEDPEQAAARLGITRQHLRHLLGTVAA